MSVAIPLPFSTGSVRVTQGFDTNLSHKNDLKWGVDFGMEYGATVHAVIGGEIVAFRQDVDPTYVGGAWKKDSEGNSYREAGSGHGNYITVKSIVGETELYTTYAHLSKNFLNESMGIDSPYSGIGQHGSVTMGQVIGKVGASGLRYSYNQDILRIDPNHPELGDVNIAGRHLHLHFGTKIVHHSTMNEHVASGKDDATLPVYFDAFGVNPDGTPVNPSGEPTGKSYSEFVDAHDDFPSDTSTHGEIFVHFVEGNPDYPMTAPGLDQIWGSIQARPNDQKDTDWFAVELTAGYTYTFALRGEKSAEGILGNPTLPDPMLRLRGPDGEEQLQWNAVDYTDPKNEFVERVSNLLNAPRVVDADGNIVGDPRASFTPTESGIYYLVAFSESGEVGSYRLSGVLSAKPSEQPMENSELSWLSGPMSFAGIIDEGHVTSDDDFSALFQSMFGLSVENLTYTGSLDAAFLTDNFTITGAGFPDFVHGSGLLLSSGGFPGPELGTILYSESQYSW